MIPFMRVGWVNLFEDSGQYLFKITDAGVNASDGSELPDIKDPQDRKRSFVIDPITGDCYKTEYRSRNRSNPSKQAFQVFGLEKTKKILARKGNYVAKLSIKNMITDTDPQTIFNGVALEGEEVIGYTPRPFDEPYREDIRYTIAEVSINGDINGVPERLSIELREQIVNAANKQREKIKLLESTHIISAEEIEIHSLKKYNGQPIKISKNQYKLILGGQQHQDHLFDLIKNARSRLIIHSTFIHPDQLNILLPILLDTAKRSVQIDLMWGQLDPDQNDEKGYQQYQAILESLKNYQKIAYDEGVESYFKIHLDASGSHSKFIICDYLEEGYIATFGSCNWLASGFKKFEASICINSLEFVSESLRIASILSKGKNFIADDFSQDLARLSNQLKAENSLNKKRESNTEIVTIQIIGANDHEDYLLKARDEAGNRIIVCSHRVGQVADNSILPTVLSNKKAIKTAIYGRATGKKGGMSTSQSKQLKSDYESKGFNIVVADEPQIHAKILAWDDDQALITSLNWLSASSHVDPLREIGVYIKDSDIVERIVKELSHITT